jgi:hypothetical protein
MADYSKMTDQDFDEILADKIDGFCHKRPSSILQITGIYEILSEYFNNEVLQEWEDMNPEEEENED